VFVAEIGDITRFQRPAVERRSGWGPAGWPTTFLVRTIFELSGWDCACSCATTRWSPS